jgi:hypothetical protein
MRLARRTPRAEDKRSPKTGAERMRSFLPLLAALCAFGMSSAFAQDEASPRAQAYRWVELSFGGLTFRGEDGFGATAPGTYRLAGTAPVGGPVYLVASYTGANFPYQFLDWLSGGVGVHVPLAPNIDAIAQVTLEQLESGTYGEDGIGLETGFRWFGDGAELGVSADYAELDGFGGLIGDRYWGVNLAAFVPLTRTAGVSLRIERTYAMSDAGGDGDFHTYLAGVRVGF